MFEFSKNRICLKRKRGAIRFNTTTNLILMTCVIQWQYHKLLLMTCFMYNILCIITNNSLFVSLIFLLLSHYMKLVTYLYWYFVTTNLILCYQCMRYHSKYHFLLCDNILHIITINLFLLSPYKISDMTIWWPHCDRKLIYYYSKDFLL